MIRNLPRGIELNKNLRELSEDVGKIIGCEYKYMILFSVGIGE
jgi:hypothetical protein